MVRPNVADKTHIIFSNVSNRTRAYWVLLLPTVFVGLTIALKNIALPMYSDNPFVDSLDRSWLDDMSPWIEGCAGLCCDGLGGFKSYPGFCCHVRTSQFLLLTVSFDIVSLRDCVKKRSFRIFLVFNASRRYDWPGVGAVIQILRECA